MRGPPEDRTDRQLLSFGVVNLDKPPGPSAHEVAGWIRDACDDALRSDAFPPAGAGDGATSTDPTAGDDESDAGLGRAAHGGTLDPKVTGCLPVLLGNATRIARVLHRGDKEYVAVLELHGQPPGDLESVVASFEAPLYQKPPRKSAVSRQLRVREIHELDVLEVRDRQVLLRIRCEGGTYVRKLCHDLGLALGTGAHMGDLRRVGTTPFDDRDLSTMAELFDGLAYAREGSEAAEGGEPATDPPIAISDVVDPAERALEHLPRVTIAESAAREVANGAPVYAPGVLDAAGPSGAELASDAGPAESDEAPLVGCYTPDGAVVCLGRLVGDPNATEGTVVDLERVLV